jgi:hypothetical protein
MSQIDERPNVLRKSILVGCEVETAFQVWTEQMNIWWPRGHSISGNPGTNVFLESRVGGRLYERTPDGVEFDWGHVAVWQPPSHFAYDWYLVGTLERPSRVDVYFVSEKQNQTKVNVEHRGPELLGDVWFQRVLGFNKAWEAVFRAFSSCEAIL